MTIRHHLSESLLLAYSAGTLPEAFSLLVATHVSLCDECRAQLAAFDALGGAVMEQDESAEMAPDSLDRVLARLDTPQRARPAAPSRAGLFPAPLAGYVGGGVDRVKWRPVGMGVRQAILVKERDASVRLLAIPAGQAVPDHGHGGTELTLVLQGAFRDETGRYGPGDVEMADESLEHTPVAEPGPECICLAATDARLRFKGLVPRLAQPFLRI